MSELWFLLSHPKMSLSKFDGKESWQLVFNNAKLTRGTGKYPVAYEVANHDPGHDGEYRWETVELASDDVENTVHLRMGGTIPDLIMVEFPPRLVTGLTLSTENFSPLFSINWSKQFILLSVGLKYPATIPDKLPFNREKGTMEFEVVDLPVNWFSISLEELPFPESYLHKPTTLPPDKFPLFHATKQRLRGLCLPF